MSVIDIHDSAPSRVEAADLRDRFTESREEAARAGFEISSKAAFRIAIVASPLLPLLNRALTSAIAPWSFRTDDHVLVFVPTSLLFISAFGATRDAARRLEHEWAENARLSVSGLMAIAALLTSAFSAGVIFAQWFQIAFMPACICVPQ